MLPIGPLMIEHRLIERMVALLQKEHERVRQGGGPDTFLIEQAADFFKEYADRCHHGKEEDILFKQLAQKALAPQDNQLMEELISEHVIARRTVGRLVTAKDAYEAGQKEALSEIEAALAGLVGLYPKHIEKEDKRFFLPSMGYFSDAEKDAMLKAFGEFDRRLIHEKYEKAVEALEAR